MAKCNDVKRRSTVEKNVKIETLQADRYGSGAILFHWSMFLMVIMVGVLGLLHDSWPKQTQGFWINVHAVAGLFLWFLLICRIFWRAAHAPPPFATEVGAFSRRWSGPVHITLYVLMFVIPVLGVITFIWHGRVFNFGLFELDFAVRADRKVFHPTEDVHGYLAYALFALAGIHALAALLHHFIRHDGVLGRMWPGP
jgi:cytochrome b561